jgi:ABC-type sugar transport system permease subunit
LIRHDKIKYVFLFPAILLAGIFVFWPLINLFVISLQKTNFISIKFVGIKNYIDLFQNKAFLQSIVNSGFYIILLVIGQIGGATFLSLLVCNLHKKWHDFVRFAFYIPIISSGVFISALWKWVFHLNGPLNWFLGLFNIEPIIWFAQSISGIPAISFIVITAAIGTNAIMILASILSIDTSMLEQAQIDGASWFQIKIKIILPQIVPILLMLGLVSAINAMAIFENVQMLAPYEQTSTMVYSIYNMAFTLSKHGLAAAGAVVLLFITIGITLLKNKIEKSSIK